MQSKILLMSLSHMIGGWLFPEGVSRLCQNRGYPLGLVTTTLVPTMVSHHASIPLPSSPSPANPSPREGGSGARERKGKPDRSRWGKQARTAEQNRVWLNGMGVSRD